MAFKDWTQSMWDKIKASTPLGQLMGEAAMSNGGITGYKPNTAKHRAMRDTAQQTAANAAPQMDPTMTGMGWEQVSQVEQPTGFGGYTGMVPPQATGYQGGGYQPTGYQPSYAEPAMGTDYYAPQQAYGTGYTTSFQGAPQATQGQSAAPQPQAPLDNISYMPGSIVGEDGRAYSHCERIAAISNVGMCYRIIEFMRNNESVIVSTEQITDEDENQRCLDLIYGAAFAMNCTFTRVSGKNIYLITPSTVMVIPYKAVRQLNEQDIAARWPEQEWSDHRDRYGRSESRYAPRSQGYGRQQEGYTFGRRDYARQDDYAPYGGYNAAGYGR